MGFGMNVFSVGLLFYRALERRRPLHTVPERRADSVESWHGPWDARKASANAGEIMVRALTAMTDPITSRIKGGQAKRR